MHELSVCQALVDQLEALGKQQQAVRVVKLLVGIGPLSQAFPLAAAGTLAEDAELAIEDRPVRVHCLQCGQDSDASVNRLLCGHCGDWRTELLSGDELMLVQVEFMRERAYV
jgi:hydrogenase nickel incorporation protein HypA/HybF